jgi:hypothetical protein
MSIRQEFDISNPPSDQPRVVEGKKLGRAVRKSTMF